MSAVAAAEPRAATRAGRGLPPWWPLAALIVLAAALRLATLTEQGFWYDEAFTPVHVFHSGLGATLRSVVHSENTPPLWYVLAWVDVRLFGDGALALRLPSALAGIATVPVVWALGSELAGRRTGLIAAALVAVNPLFVWYSQEARAYSLFVLFSALAMLCFARLLHEPSRKRALGFALSGALALLTHYFAVFLLLPMALLLLREKASRRFVLPALGVIALVGLALLPLISAQGGHGTQWIGRWALSSRLQAIPQYFLTGYSGAPLGHGVELLVALPMIIGALLGGWRLLAAGRMASSLRAGAWISFAIAAFAVLAPIVLAVLGADYLAPRNLVGAMIPVSVLVAILFAAVDSEAGHAVGDRARAGASAGAGAGAAKRRLPLGAMLAAASVAASLAISLDVDASPRLQRGNWRDVAKLLRAPTEGRVITTVELGAAPLEYYLHAQMHLRNLSSHDAVSISEIDETGYSPLRKGAAEAPAPGFRLLERRNVDGLFVYRFVSSIPRTVSEADLRRHVITPAHPEVLVPSGADVVRLAARTGSLRLQMSSSDQNI
ncbi:MAG TPA: glycosyltransferase family 39 protein [Solirubrobacteraceae bacterium]|nr:glycosyltransferase family 39 protein [Solirubrobacteraceae bacterium]